MSARFFKYSLAGDASHWFKQLLPGMRESWTAICTAFLRHFSKKPNERAMRGAETSEASRTTWVEFMFNKVLEGQQKIAVQLNGRIDFLYLQLNKKFKDFNTRVTELEDQLFQTSESLARYEAMIGEKGESSHDCHVNAVISDDFWVEVKRESLGEGVFRVEETSVSTPPRRRSTRLSKRRSTPSVENVEIAESTSIDRFPDQDIDRRTYVGGDRQETQSIDRHFRSSVRLPSIDASRFTRQAMLARKRNVTTTEPVMSDEQTEETPRKKQKVSLKKKSDPGMFVVPCMIEGHRFPDALCDTGSSVSIIPRVMAERLGLKIEPSYERFIFVDCSRVDSGGICKNVPLQIQDVLIPVDFQVMDVSVDSLLLGRAFMATVGAICDMQTNRLCLSLINDKVYYETYKNKPALRNFRDDAELVAACFCNYDHDEESDERPSIDTQPRGAIDVNHYASIDRRTRESIDIPMPDLTYNYQADFEYSPKHTDEWREDFWEEHIQYRGIREEEAEVYQVSHQIGNTTSIDDGYIASIDTEEKEESETESEARREREYGYIEPDRFGIFRDSRGRARAMDGRILRVAESDIAEILAMINGAQNLCNRCDPQGGSIDAELRPSIDGYTQTRQRFDNQEVDVGSLKPDEFGIFRDNEGFARALDGRILHISKEDVADVLIMAGGSDNIFNKQKKEPASIDSRHRVSIDVSRRNEKADYLASIDARHRASIDVNVPERNRFCTADALGSESSRSSGWINPLLIDGRVEYGKRAYHNGKRIFRWEKKDEYGVWRDEEGNARAIDGRIVHVQENDIRAVLERANMMEQSFICLPEDYSKFVLRKQETYSRDEIDDMIRDIHKAQEMSHEESYNRLTDAFYPLDKSITDITARMDAMEEEMKNFQRAIQPEHRASIDETNPRSIDGDDDQKKDEFVTGAELEKKVDDLIFSMEIMKEDFNRQIQTNEEYAEARLGLQQRSIGHIQRSMSSIATAAQFLETQRTTAEEAMKIYIGFMFNKSKTEIDTFLPSVDGPPL